MANSIAQKLKIKEDYVLRTLHAPTDFKEKLHPLPEGVHITIRANRFDQLHWFVQNQAALEADLDTVLGLVEGNILCWIYYPKGSSKVQTDLTRDKGWEPLLAHKELQWISLISFDETWSAFGFRQQSEADKKKASNPQEREIFNWIDAANKTVRLPDDLADAFKKDKEATAIFEALSFTNKKEYLEWVVNAKREETRKQRVSETIERIHRGWKNPRNM
jgi:hypothetical protein